jgi:hypothetical protein
LNLKLSVVFIRAPSVSSVPAVVNPISLHSTESCSKAGKKWMEAVAEGKSERPSIEPIGGIEMKTGGAVYSPRPSLPPQNSFPGAAAQPPVA